jgi:DNA mismatch repair protein MutS
VAQTEDRVPRLHGSRHGRAGAPEGAGASRHDAGPPSRGQPSSPTALPATRPPSRFRSILFPADAVPAGLESEEPASFADLNLDQVVARVTSGRDEYELRPLFWTPLESVPAIGYRHGVFRDLEDPALLEGMRQFADRMRTVRAQLRQAGKLHYRYQKRRWFLEAVAGYCAAVSRLRDDLDRLSPRSSGFVDLRDYLDAYVQSDGFTTVLADQRRLLDELGAIRYSLHIRDNRIRVDRFDSGVDYGTEVAETFRRFEQGAAKTYKFEFPNQAEMNHVEAAILDLVARLNPETFGFLDRFAEEHRNFLDATVGRFDRELQVYLSWLDHVAPLQHAGLAFCYPDVIESSKEVSGRDVFDIALATKLIGGNQRVVLNSFALHRPERVIVVTGPNQGGKTTFARMFGQLHYLARLGLPVPGSQARLFMFDRLFTHFEREEDLGNLSGKLEDDLVRIHATLEKATTDSLVIMNESFSSTTVQDSLLLSREILHRLIERGALCVSVTFLDELASLGPETVSMVSTVDPADPAIRTFRVVRKPADGLAYALAIAQKHGLTYERVRGRIRPGGREGYGTAAR